MRIRYIEHTSISIQRKLRILPHLIMESSSAVGLFLWSAISAKEVIRSDKLVEEVEEGEKVEEEGRCLQASTACCSRTGWRARATQRNCCL